MKTFRAVVTAAAALGLAITAGCSTGTSTGSASPSASASAAVTPLKVTASFYPFEYVTEQVGKDLVTVTDLTQPGAEPHDLELSPKQVAGIAESDLLIFQKGFQAAVDSALQTVTPKRTVDTASFLTLHEAAHDEGEEEHGDEHDHGALDPHTWLDPNNMVAVTEHVRDALAEAMPDAKATFTANADALITQLQQLDTDYRAGLGSCQRKVFVTSHEAFGYLAARYGLEQVGISGIEPDTEPTAARIAAVQKLAKANGVTTIFFETLVSPTVAKSIAGDLQLATDVLDPLEGLTEESRGSDYIEVMKSNLTSLQKANGCS
ncbi:MAG: metal ABC transporter substrate-binding protein [Micropruina sp.]|uniref:metal ABC transporter substrate-binding protein n=1 Tax=Micropruina sp. TaxID=2737536 RepID=UPI0039E6BBC3